MKKLVKRNFMRQDSVQCYVNQCDIDCLSCTCQYEAARQENRLSYYQRRWNYNGGVKKEL